MVPSVLQSLPVKKLWGIGRHTEEKLRVMGIRTCGELGAAPLSLLTKKFGILGGQLKGMGNGILDRSLESATRDPKSIGHSRTFSERHMAQGRNRTPASETERDGVAEGHDATGIKAGKLPSRSDMLTSKHLRDRPPWIHIQTIPARSTGRPFHPRRDTPRQKHTAPWCVPLVLRK